MIRKSTKSLLAFLAILAPSASSLAAQSPSFGNSVVIDGDEIFIAEPNPNFRSGAVYIYEQSDGEWRQSALLRAPDSERADGFGTVLAKNGNTLFVGQRNGPLHVFERPADGGPWQPAGTVEGDGVDGLDPGCGQYGYCGTDFGLVLDGELYDDMITSFEYEAGDHYILDANRYRDGRYLLNEIASRTRAAGTEEEITIDRHRVECGDGHPGYCKVVNGAPYRGEIVGFQPAHEYDYRLRVERFDMFPEGVTGAPYVPAHGYRWLETLERTSG